MIKWIKSLYHLSKIVPIIDMREWEKSDMSQLATFLKTTSAGAKLLQTLRQGLIDQAMNNLTDRGKEHASYHNGMAAGYAAALGTIDQCADAALIPEEEKPEPDLNIVNL